MAGRQGGEIVPRDPAVAVEWFRKAAVSGEPYAERMLGVAYINGVGVTKDKAQGIDWLKKAAAHGDDVAQKRLAELGAPGQ